MEGVGRENYSIYTRETDQTPQRKGRLPGRCKKHIGHAPSRAKLRRGQRNNATLEQGRQNTNLKSFRRVSRRKPAPGDYKRHMSKTSPERRLRELLPSRIRHEGRTGRQTAPAPSTPRAGREHGGESLFQLRRNSRRTPPREKGSTLFI